MKDIKLKTMGIVLSKEQKRIFNELEKSNENYYITGKAGTGKSLLLKYMVEETEKKVIVLAPTGVAAINVEGQTIHSFFGIGPSVQDPKDHLEIEVTYKTKEILKRVDAIIIDEISMVSVDLMETINIKCQKVRGNNLPFGGIQIICFGDLYQLPPVVSDKEIHRYLDDIYGGIFFFNAPVFKKSKLHLRELEKNFRQKEKSFQELLNKIRIGDNSKEVLDKLNSRLGEELPKEGYIVLAGKNEVVNRINLMKLNQIDSKEHTYKAIIEGDINRIIFPTETELKLKVGAQIMMLTNDKTNRWVNGTLGIITSLSDDIIKVCINDVEHAVDKYTWCKSKYFYNPFEKTLDREIIGSFTQFPLKLAWAVTIHKSQGKTYESVFIDLESGAFDAGQTYVALSRCTSFKNLYLNNEIKASDIMINAQVEEFMNQKREA